MAENNLDMNTNICMSRRQRRICASYLKHVFPEIMGYIVGTTGIFLNKLDIEVQRYSQTVFGKNLDNIKQLILAPIQARLSFRQRASTHPVAAYAHIGPFLEQYLGLWHIVDEDFYDVLYNLQTGHFRAMTQYTHIQTMAYVQKGIHTKVEETTELVLWHALRHIRAVQKGTAF